MPNYYVNTNAQPNGDHEVHVDTCTHGALPQNRRQLGFHLNCQSAVAQARAIYRTANGCAYCASACHTG